MSRIDKSVRTESLSGLGVRRLGENGVTNKGYRVSFGGHENVPKVTMMIACTTL